MRSAECTWLHSANTRTGLVRACVCVTRKWACLCKRRGGWARSDINTSGIFLWLGSVARKRELCPISIAAPGAAPLLIYHVFIVGAWLPGRTRNVNLHFLASYAARARARSRAIGTAGRQRTLGAINGIERSQDRSLRVYFVLRLSRKRQARDVSRRAAPVFLHVPLVSSIVINIETSISN